MLYWNTDDKIQSKDSKLVRLNSLHKMIEQCEKCELYKTRNKVVSGEGNSNAKILIIGEGPGAQNDLEGRPFIGRGGAILDNLLIKSGLNREELFLTNIIFREEL